jgi:Protein of unknown function (DUF1059)
MRRIDCSDFLPGAIACKHVVEAETDEELLELARTHARGRLIRGLTELWRVA